MATSETSESTRRSPYQGLIPYDEKDAPFFFGREKDTRLIIASLFASPLTLLYGASGVGKSSVLRAGVAYHLRQRDDLLVVVFSTWQGNPLSELKAAVAKAAMSVQPTGLSLAASASLDKYLAACSKQLGRRLMIILDQFEEYFLYQQQDEAFVEEFSQAVLQTMSPTSFLISIREDALAKLDRFEGHIPILFDNYLRIEHLSLKDAREAIEEPIKKYNSLNKSDASQISIEPTLVDAVLNQLQSGQVALAEGGRGVVQHEVIAEAQIETPYLQMVMTRLWDEEIGAGSNHLRLETLQRLGGAERIVETHLDSTMSLLSPDDQSVAAGIFHYLVTPSRTKIAYSVSDLAEQAKFDQKKVTRVVDRLSEVRILRPVDSLLKRQKQTRYEIFHDVMASPILKWQAEYEKAEAHRRAEQQQIEAEKQARVDEQAKQAGRFRRLTAALAILTVALAIAVLIALVIYTRAQKTKADAQRHYAEYLTAEAVAQSRNAEQAKSEAEAQKTAIEKERDIATKAKGAADNAKSFADKQRVEADVQRGKAEQARREANMEKEKAVRQNNDLIAAQKAALKAQEKANEQGIKAEANAKFFDDLSNSKNVNSSGTNNSNLPAADKPEPTAAQTATLEGGQPVNWNQQGIAWMMPAKWSETEKSTNTSFVWKSPGSGDAAFVIGSISPMSADFPTDLSLKAFYDQAAGRQKNARLRKFTGLSLTECAALSFSKLRPNPKTARAASNGSLIASTRDRRSWSISSSAQRDSISTNTKTRSSRFFIRSSSHTNKQCDGRLTTEGRRGISNLKFEVPLRLI